MKKILSLILIGVMLTFNMVALLSCNGNKQPTAEFVLPAEGYDGSEVTITFYHTMGSALREKLDEAIVRFNELYPNITVVHEQTGSYDDVRSTISTEIGSGTGTDASLAYCYPDHVALYNTSGATVKLDSLINSKIEVTRADGTTEILGYTDAQIADFIPGYYAEGAQFDDAGTMYTVPLSKSTEVLYYNKTFFEANADKGLYVPTTWQELADVCAKIKQIDPASIPLGYDSEANLFITMCEQLGTPYTSLSDKFIFDDERNYEFVEMFREWYEKKWVTTQELNSGKYTSELFTATTGTKSYMSIGSSAGAAHQAPDAANGEYPFEVGIAAIPTWANEDGTKKPLKVISQGPSLCIFNKSNPQEVVASWLFAKFLTTDVEFQAKFSMVSGYVPVIQSVQENEVYADFLEKANGTSQIAALSVKQCLAQADYYFTSPAFNGSSAARDEVGKLIQACLSQQPTGNETVRDMIVRLFRKSIEECEYNYG